jgi:hypothetical protein
VGRDCLPLRALTIRPFDGAGIAQASVESAGSGRN